MTIMIKLNNGKTFKGDTFEEVTVKLKESTWLEENKIEYMAGVAQRTTVCTGEEISYTNPEEFIKELDRVKILQLISAE